MNTAVETYAIVTILLALSIGALLVDRSMRAFRSRRWHCVHEPVALRIVLRTLTSPRLRNIAVRIPRMPRRRLCDTLLSLSLTTYNIDRRAMSALTDAYGSERIIGRLSPFTTGYRRAERLLMLASMPTGRRIPVHRLRHWSAASRYIHFYTLMADMARTPVLAEYLIETCDIRLSPSEISQITAMLHRGSITLDYRRLLRSSDRNLRMTGIAIVRHFSIEEACDMLHDIAASDPDAEICREALITLCAAGCTIDPSLMAEHIGGMDAAIRRSICRHAILNGYPPAAFAPLFGDHGDDRLAALAESNKYTIA